MPIILSENTINITGGGGLFIASSSQVSKYQVDRFHHVAQLQVRLKYCHINTHLFSIFPRDPFAGRKSQSIASS